MRYEYNCTSFRVKFLKQDKYLKRGTGVEISGGFVGKDNGRIVHQCAGDGNTLHLSAGHLVRLMFETVAQSHRL